MRQSIHAVELYLGIHSEHASLSVAKAVLDFPCFNCEICRCGFFSFVVVVVVESEVSLMKNRFGAFLNK
jgi:hypothetical protein